VADRDAGIRRLLADHLIASGAEIIFATDGQEAVQQLNSDLALAIVDNDLPQLSGLSFLETVKKRNCGTLVVILSEVADANLLNSVFQNGGFDFMVKPLDFQNLMRTLKKALEVAVSRLEVRRLKHSVFSLNSREAFVGSSSQILGLVRQAKEWAKEDSPLFIQGETGTGKSLLARIIHQESGRRDGAFVVLDGHNTPRGQHLFELFGGHGDSGSESGSTLGKLALASNGTLFIDNIDGLCPSALNQLTQVLLERRRGSSPAVKATNARILVASREPLDKLLNKSQLGSAFEQLFIERILSIPPLRKRLEDVGSLTAYTLNRISKENGHGSLEIEGKALAILEKASWPGNIRQLEEVLEHASLRCERQQITTEDLPGDLKPATNAEKEDNQPELGGRSLRDLEKIAILQTLDLTSGNKSRAAQILGISEKSIYNKMKRHNLRS